jgi:tetratricopeptide (TPR) repeat protein
MTEQTFDVFVSYAHSDAHAVRLVADALKQAGLRVWIDEREIEYWTGITESIENALARSKALLAYYTTAYPWRRACQWELTAAFLAAQRRGNPQDRVLVLNPERGVDHIQPVELRDALFGRPPGGDVRAMADLAVRVAERVGWLEGLLGEARAITPRWIGGPPVGSTLFVGRLTDMWAVHSALHATKFGVITAARGAGAAQICGLGGVGKTMLAREYAMRFGAAYPGGIFWLRANGDGGISARDPRTIEDRRRGQVKTFAAELGLQVQGRSLAEIEGAFVGEIERRGFPCLWVVDDLPSELDGEAVWQWFSPHPLAKTLITTRSQEYGALATPIDLDVLAPEEAYELLTSRRRPEDEDEKEAAWEIVEMLGRHALALDVAGAALDASRGLQDFAQFREALEDTGQDELELAAELEDVLPTAHQPSIAATMVRSIRQLGQEGKDFLRLAAVLAAAPIPAWLVEVCLLLVDKLEEKEAKRRATLALRQAERLSLAERSTELEGARTVHNLVSRTIRFANEVPRRQQAIRSAAMATLGGLLRAVEEPRFRRGLEVELAHARELARRGSDQADADLLGLVGTYDLASGGYRSAELTFRQQWQVLVRLLGADNPGTLRAMGTVGTALYYQGNFEEAKFLQEQTLVGQLQTVGEGDQDTLRTRDNLGLTLAGLEDLPGAQEQHEKALEGFRRLLGEDDPDTIKAINNLALVLLQQGDLDRARATFEDVLRMAREVLGPEEPGPFITLDSLAGIVWVQGDKSKARALQREATQGLADRLGEDHPQALMAMEHLASMLLEDEPATATDLQTRVVQSYGARLGPSDRRTVSAQDRLGVMLVEGGDPQRARALLEEIIDERLRSLGPEDSATTRARYNLGVVLVHLDDLEGAIAVLEDVVEVRSGTLGADDPDTRAAQETLAEVRRRAARSQ